MGYHWNDIAIRARELGLDRVRPGDIATIAGILHQVDPIPFPGGVLDQVRDFLIDSVRNKGLKEDRPGGVYLTFFGSDAGSEFMKVGVSSNLKSRINTIRTSNPMLSLWTWVADMPGMKDARRLERGILTHLVDSAASGEWVKARCNNVDCAQALVDSIAEFANEALIFGPVQFARVES